MKTSPCNQTCKIEQGKCIGCYRTLEQIRAWGGMTETERLAAMMIKLKTEK
jgi:predicted Fe-S protein YdhL (DUF1289 family)